MAGFWCALGGPWVVQADGSRRLLGGYDVATWSPHGLFVAVAAGRTLNAVEPDGAPRWSLSAAGPVADPRWSPSGFQVAYRAGRALRVVAGDGIEGALLDPSVAPLPSSWSPQGLGMLAFVDAGGLVRVANTATDEVGAGATSLPGIETLEWAPPGTRLLEASPQALRVRPLATSKLAGRVTIGPPRRIPLPAGSRLQAAAFSPDGRTIAALLRTRGQEAGTSAGAGPRSEILLIEPRNGSRRRLFAVSGRLTDLAWSPRGSRLLAAWPDADQWLFLPVAGSGRIRAIGGVASAFAPGQAGGALFPRIEGWCCRQPLPGL